MRLLYSVKNTRSWLDDLSFDLTLEESEKYAHGIVEYDTEDETTYFPVDLPDEKLSIVHGIAELESGLEVTEFTKSDFDFKKKYFAVAELESGTETVSPESIDDDLWWQWYLRQKWRDWQINPAAQPYTHPESEIDNIPPFDPDSFPPDANLLQLYFGFPGNRYRYLTLQNPREDLTAADLNHVGDLSRNLLKSTAGLNSQGLVRAFLLSRKTFKVF